MTSVVGSPTPALAASLATIHARAFAEGPRPWSASELLALMRSDGVFAVLDDEVTPLGFGLFRRVLDEAELLTIAVDPARWNLGVGRALLSHGLNDLAAIGVRHVFLEVRASNASALSLYAAAGFELVNERSDYYDKSDAGRAIVMRCNL